MAKRIVNRAERNAERYNAKEMGYQLYEDSLNGKIFDRLMPMIVSEQNIILAYRNICKNTGSKTPGTDGKTIVEIQELPIEMVRKTIRNKFRDFYTFIRIRIQRTIGPWFITSYEVMASSNHCDFCGCNTRTFLSAVRLWSPGSGFAEGVAIRSCVVISSEIRLYKLYLFQK